MYLVNSDLPEPVRPPRHDFVLTVAREETPDAGAGSASERFSRPSGQAEPRSKSAVALGFAGNINEVRELSGEGQHFVAVLRIAASDDFVFRAGVFTPFLL